MRVYMSTDIAFNKKTGLGKNFEISFVLMFFVGRLC